VSEEGECEASQRNACPESGCDETNFAGVSVAELDEEGDYPSWDCYFGALIAKDEECAKDGGFVWDEGFEGLPFSVRTFVPSLSAWSVFSVLRERR
jgi:hypothetical protein